MASPPRRRPISTSRWANWPRTRRPSLPRCPRRRRISTRCAARSVCSNAATSCCGRCTRTATSTMPPTRRKSPNRSNRCRTAISNRFSASLPPRDYFTDEIRRQLSHELRRGGFLLRRLFGPRDARPGDAGRGREGPAHARSSNMTARRVSGAAPARPSPPISSGPRAPGARRFRDVRVSRDSILKAPGIRPSCSRSATARRVSASRAWQRTRMVTGSPRRMSSGRASVFPAASLPTARRSQAISWMSATWCWYGA